MSSTTSARCGSSSESSAPRLAVLGELELGAEQRRVRVDERRAVVLEQLGGRQRAVELGELRLVVEQVEVARRRRPGTGRSPASPSARSAAASAPAGRPIASRRPGRGPAQQRCPSAIGAEADAALPEEPAAGDARCGLVPAGARGQLRRRIGSFLGDRLVEVQQHAGDDRVGGQLRGRGARGQVGGRSARAGGDLPRVDPAVGDPLASACRAARAGPSRSASVGRPADAAAEGVGDPLGVGRAALGQDLPRQGPGGTRRRPSRSGSSAPGAACSTAAGGRTTVSPSGTSKVASIGYGVDRRRQV